MSFCGGFCCSCWWLVQHLVTREVDAQTQQSVCTRLVLAFTDPQQHSDAIVEVDSRLVRLLKPHQVDGKSPGQWLLGKCYVNRSMVSQQVDG